MTPQEVEREVQVLRSIDHHAIVKLHQIYEHEDYSIILLELVNGGELFARVAELERLDEQEAVFFIAQILLGVNHMHQLGIVHLDLKPENIMIEDMETKRIKIIDFGLARRLNPNEVIQDMAGTPEFCDIFTSCPNDDIGVIDHPRRVAPEIVNFDPITFATDMWAIGVMTYIFGTSSVLMDSELAKPTPIYKTAPGCSRAGLSGISPFAGDTQVETFQNILECSVTFDRDEFLDVSPEARDFITRLLRKNPRKRDTASQCLRHPWVAAVIRQLTGEPEIIQKIDLNGVGALKTSPSSSLSGSNRVGGNSVNKLTRRQKSAEEAIEVDSGQERCRHSQVIQKINLNGILTPEAHSTSNSSGSSPKLRESTRKCSSNSKSVEIEKAAPEAGERTPIREPQIIQKINLNSVLPSMSSQNTSIHMNSERTKRKSVSTHSSDTQTNPEFGEKSIENVKPPKEVVHKHKVVQINGSATKEAAPTPIKSEKSIISRLADLQVNGEPSTHKSNCDSIFGRASKWLEATNNALDKKFRPTSNAATSSSFHRARNAFISKNALAERKLVFTRVRLAGDMDHALPGFKWRVLPTTSTACEEGAKETT
ncbi:Death-associated protein kinase 2 [Echinococcus granulosus]|uniref:Death-associated protein kinase 2 n=1 Tax=Echinococcus granulosus TaxID=6210 RepID=W6UC78_ECHGR|nr:Death-associated protein kinase 2 [Echinococcus granulosus]EUB58820.1 Death-associated protein kinase 2 [Echinococcus granulosus]